MPDAELYVTEADLPGAILSHAPICEILPGTSVRKPDATPFDFAHGKCGIVHHRGDKYGVQWAGSDSVFEYPSETLFSVAKEAVNPAAEIETKVAARPAEAKLIRVTDQASLDAVADRLAVNKALQKEASEIFDGVISAAHEAHKKAIAAKKRVTDPLTTEETILKSACQHYIVEQRRIQEENERIARLAREAEERRLLAEAEEKRQREEKDLNERLAREHAERIEQHLNDLPADTPVEVVQAICDLPAPEAVTLPMDIPELPAVVRSTPAVSLPKGLSVSEKYKAVVTNLSLLCRAVADGSVPSSYVEPNMTALNARARADKQAMNVPGVKVERDFSTAQRSR
jgi:hypothetical protein